jgi:hypothetical protein
LKKTNKKHPQNPQLYRFFHGKCWCVEVVNKQNRRLSGIVKYLKKEPAVIRKTKYPPKTKKKKTVHLGGGVGIDPVRVLF